MRLAMGVNWCDRRRRSGLALAAAAVCLALPVAAVAMPSPPFAPVQGSPFPTDSAPLMTAFSPTGALLATANYLGGDISLFTVNAQTGMLTAVSSSPFAAGQGVDDAVFSPSGSLLAATNLADGTVSIFSVDASNGALNQVQGSPFTVGDAPRSVSFSPDGSLLAVTNSEDNTVSIFAVSSTGTLSQVAGSPFATGSNPVSSAFSPDGSLLAVANSEDNTVSIFSVGAGGALTAVGGSPFDTDTTPVCVVFSPSGGLLAVASFGGISVFSVGSGGALSPDAGAPPAPSAGPVSVAFSSDGSLLAAANFGGESVSVDSVDAATGALTPALGSPFAVGDGPHSATFIPNGRLIAVANRSDSTVTMLAPAPPTATVIFPPSPAYFKQGAKVATRFACADAPNGPGIASCMDSNGISTGRGRISTKKLGTYTYAVRAVSLDGLSTTTIVTYTIMTPPKQRTAAKIKGAPRPGATLQCEPGTWTGSPTTYDFQWSRNGVPIQQATNAVYVVARIDEGSVLTCAVTVSNQVARILAKPPGTVKIPVTHVPDCPGVSGRLSGAGIGPVTLDAPRAQVQTALSGSADKREPDADVFCFTPAGIQVGYPTARILHALSASVRTAVAGRAIWTATTSPLYAAAGAAVGSTLAAAQARLRRLSPALKGSDIYIAPFERAVLVLRVDNAIVTEIGIADLRVTRGTAARKALVASIGSV